MEKSACPVNVMHTDYCRGKKSELCSGGEWFNHGCETPLSFVFFFPQFHTFIQIVSVPISIIIKLSFTFPLTRVTSAFETVSLKNKETNSYQSPFTYTPMSLNQRAVLAAV